MTLIAEYMGHDHGRCDTFFVQAESAVEAADWPQAQTALTHFLHAMQHHFTMEEERLFPAFEQQTGNSQGPTLVMRMEHDQMRELFERMRQALEQEDAEAFLGESETLLVLMQQHNAKEENILYPMADQVLAPQRERLLSEMQALGE